MLYDFCNWIPKDNSASARFFLRLFLLDPQLPRYEKAQASPVEVEVSDHSRHMSEQLLG